MRQPSPAWAVRVVRGRGDERRTFVGARGTRTERERQLRGDGINDNRYDTGQFRHPLERGSAREMASKRAFPVETVRRHEK